MTDIQQMQKTIWTQGTNIKESLHKILFNSIKRTQRYFEFKLDTLIQTDRTQIDRPGSRGGPTKGRPPQKIHNSKFMSAIGENHISYRSKKLKMPPLLLLFWIIFFFKSLICKIYFNAPMTLRFTYRQILHNTVRFFEG